MLTLLSAHALYLIQNGKILPLQRFSNDHHQRASEKTWRQKIPTQGWKLLKWGNSSKSDRLLLSRLYTWHRLAKDHKEEVSCEFIFCYKT
jgi:hypothetical protein